MDVRLLALNQEQSTAFGRAAAAGFNSGNMTDLMAFSEFFGADRLRVACINFLIVSQKRIVEPEKLNPQAMSSGCDMLPNIDVLPKREGLPHSSIRASQRNEADMPKGSHYSEDRRTLMVNDGAVSAPSEGACFDGLLSRGAGGTEARKRWGPPENIRPKLFGDQSKTDSAISNSSENLIGHGLEVHSINRTTETGFPKNEKAHVEGSSWSLGNDAAERQVHILIDSAQEKGLISKYTTVLKMDQISGSQVAPKVHEPNSPKGRLSSPGRRSEPGGSTYGPGTAVQTINHVPSFVVPNKQMSSIAKPNSSQIKEDNNSLKSHLVSASVRRLSVQDAISLFEDKQRRESVEAPKKQHLDKQEIGGVSMEGVNASLLSGNMAPRGRNTTYICEAGKVLQENRVSSQQEAAIASSECLPSEAANFISRGTVDALLPRQGEHAFEPQTKAFLKASDTAFQPCCPTTKPEETSSKLSDQVLADCLCKILESEFQDPVRFNLGKSEAQETHARELQVRQGPQNSESNLSMARTIDILNSESGSAKPEIIENRSRESETERATTRSSRRESFGSSRVDSPQYDTQSHVRMDANHTFNDADYSSEHRGRFYEQYRKLRDAKLMEESDCKRAEREAKLRLMEETLLLRKAELNAQAMRLSKNNNSQARAAKLQAQKADLYISQRTKENGGDERYREISCCSNSRSISPPFTPFAGKEEASASKSQSGRKPAAVSQKGATPPRRSIRGASVSPKLTPCSATGSTTRPRKSVASSVTDNPLTKSVPSFTNLRKENTKPVTGRPSGNGGLQAKDGGSGRIRVTEVLPLEANVNLLVCTPPPGNGPAKEDKVYESALVRKSSANSKTLSMSSDDGVSAPPKVQREVGSESKAPRKSKHDGASPFQEAKQFAENKGNFGPGLGLGMIQQLPLHTVEATNGSNEESPFMGPDNTRDNSQTSEEVQGTINLKDTSEVENMHIDFIDESVFAPDSTNSIRLQTISAAYASGEGIPHGHQLDARLVTEKDRHTISFPMDIETHKHHAAEICLDFNCIPSEKPTLIQERDSNLRSQLEKGDGNASQSRYNISMSFRASSFPHEHHLPVFSSVPASPASPPNSGVVQVGTILGHFSPSSATTYESPSKSPADWNSSQTQYTPGAELTQFNRKWAGPQKLGMVVSNKEPAKGFKRLLNFARKTRALDAADWASTYMMSEGDEESEDQRLSTDELTANGSLEERKIIDIGGEQYSSPYQLSAAQSVRSSIPTPPANFRLRDDHLMGSTMLKAPKSFFSLSSFRNKGSEGKAR